MTKKRAVEEDTVLALNPRDPIMIRLGFGEQQVERRKERKIEGKKKDGENRPEAGLWSE